MRFEVKKIFSKTSSKIVLALIFLFVIYSVHMANYLVWLNEDGTEMTGRAAAEKLREEEAAWSGPLTADRIADVIEQKWNQGNRGIRMLLTRAYGGLDYTDSTVVDSLTAEDASCFYGNRVKSLEEWLKKQGTWYTNEEQDFFIRQYEKMEVPLNYEYTKGWTQLFSAASNLQIFLVLAIGFLVAGIFSEEYRTNAYAVYFSSVQGRGKAIRAKIGTGFLLITVIYWSAFLLFSGCVLGTLGFGGAEARIQISAMGWKSIYNITFLQEYLLIAAGGYVGCLFADSLAMLVSARTKSTVVSVIVPFAVIFAPSVIRLVNSPLADKINGLMPYQLTQINYLLSEFYVYRIFGVFCGAVGILLVGYLIAAVLLQPVMYLVFRRRQG